jgi:hypothetical protein
MWSRAAISASAPSSCSRRPSDRCSLSNGNGAKDAGSVARASRWHAERLRLSKPH